MDGSQFQTSVAGIAQALAKAQLEMGPALKDSTNPAFKSKYADLSSVMAACLPALNKNGIAVVQPTGSDDAGRYVETILIHGATGESLRCQVPLIVGKNDMQGYGSAVTYARRYGLMCMAGIAPEDDDGNAAAAAPMVERQTNRATHPEQEAAHEAAVVAAQAMIASAENLQDLQGVWRGLSKAVQGDKRAEKAKDARKAELANADLGGDGIPY